MTIDAAVKIYDNRVNDTHKTAFRVRENLTRDKPVHEDDENNENEDATKTKKKKRRAHASTLESNRNNISVREFDLEFDIDPMFSKMSATFDAGGARGMLLNHLGVAGGCNITFDTSNATIMGATLVDSDGNIKQKVSSDEGDSEKQAHEEETHAEALLAKEPFETALPALSDVNASLNSMRLCPALQIFYNDLSRFSPTRDVEGEMDQFEARREAQSVKFNRHGPRPRY